jgi:glycosyltransferase involved in cell wall biosynthesis
LNIYYSLADVMVVPSRQETLCQSATESISSGTPVVGFLDTGLTEVITHKVNGYLADYENAISLNEGIKYCLMDSKKNSLSKSSREIAVNKFSQEVIAKQMLEAYKLC